MPIYVALGAAMVAMALLLGQTMMEQQSARRQARAEGDALITLNQIGYALLDAEAAQRGFLLSGNKEDLKPYAAARERLDESRKQLAKSTVGLFDPEVAEHASLLDDRIGSKIEKLDTSIAMARLGRGGEVLANVLSERNRREMVTIHQELRWLTDRQEIRRRDWFLMAEKREQQLFPLVVALGIAIVVLLVLAVRGERSRALAIAEAQQADALREANARAELLARELNHRVKNLFSVILSIISISGRKPNATPGELIEDIRARVHALSLAHSSSQGSVSNAAVPLDQVIRATLEPYADSEGKRLQIAGPDIDLPVRKVTPLGLIIHELATNAAKYGALSCGEGSVKIAWEADADADGGTQVTLKWLETGGPPPQPEIADKNGGGFGTRMTTLAAHQLEGAIERAWPASGAQITLRFRAD